MLDDLDLSGIEDERARELIIRLLNLLEDVMADLRAAQAEIQRLRDENARLKGEQGKPKIKPNRPRSPGKDVSSEKERRKPKKWSKGSKIEDIPMGDGGFGVVLGARWAALQEADAVRRAPPAVAG